MSSNPVSYFCSYVDSQGDELNLDISPDVALEGDRQQVGIFSNCLSLCQQKFDNLVLVTCSILIHPSYHIP